MRNYRSDCMENNATRTLGNTLISLNMLCNIQYTLTELHNISLSLHHTKHVVVYILEHVIYLKLQFTVDYPFIMRSRQSYANKAHLKKNYNSRLCINLLHQSHAANWHKARFIFYLLHFIYNMQCIIYILYDNSTRCYQMKHTLLQSHPPNQQIVCSLCQEAY